MRQSVRLMRSSVMAITLCLVSAMAVPALAATGEKPVVDAMKSMEDNLVALAGKTVTLHLSNGSTLTGKVAEVSKHHLRVAEISGKEYFDALVRVDAIVALEVRARGG